MFLMQLVKVTAVIAFMWAVFLITFTEVINTTLKNKKKIVLSDIEMYDQELEKFRYDVVGINKTTDRYPWRVVGYRRRERSRMEELEDILQTREYPPGRMGTPVILKDTVGANIRAMVNQGWKEHSFNQFVSELIPLNRSLPDHRDDWCKRNSVKVRDVIPLDVAVIVCFHDEAWSTLLRTVHSVLNNSPPHLLREVLLVDDHSLMPHLSTKLDEYIKQIPKVRILRTKRREGLIRARILAAKNVTASVIVFLDSHCECSPGWLTPLVDRIAQNDLRVVSPVVDHISRFTFEYIPQSVHSLRVGGFSWDLKFYWTPLSNRVFSRRTQPAAPVETPVISGGIFAISREFFQLLGYYDDGLNIWGGDNFELSFKVWMCGGTLEIVPCSHVGHVFRKNFPYYIDQGTSTRNLARVAEVWLEDYAKYFYERMGAKKIDVGDLSKPKTLREELKCASFRWYLDSVYPELKVPSESVAKGQIFNAGTGKCLDFAKNRIFDPKSSQQNIHVVDCHGYGGHQFWTYTRRGEIKRDSMCLDNIDRTVNMFLCRGNVESQQWDYSIRTKKIRNKETQQCLEIVKYPHEGYKLKLGKCLELSSQEWTMEHYVSKIVKIDKKKRKKRHSSTSK